MQPAIPLPHWLVTLAMRVIKQRTKERNVPPIAVHKHKTPAKDRGNVNNLLSLCGLLVTVLPLHKCAMMDYERSSLGIH